MGPPEPMVGDKIQANQKTNWKHCKWMAWRVEGFSRRWSVFCWGASKKRRHFGGPQEEDNPQTSHHGSNQESSATLMDKDLGEKRKVVEQQRKACKKQKVVKNTDPIGLTDDK